MRTTIRLDDALLRRAKARAAERGISLNEFIVESVATALQRRSASTAKVTELPTHGVGGLLPGVDLDDTSALQDIMDGRDIYRTITTRVSRVAERDANLAPAKKVRKRK